MEGLAVERVNGEGNRLADTHIGQLGLFQVGDHPVLRRHQRGQMGSGADVSAKTHRNLPQLAAGGGDDLRILQVDLRQLEGGFGAGHVGLQ